MSYYGPVGALFVCIWHFFKVSVLFSYLLLGNASDLFPLTLLCFSFCEYCHAVPYFVSMHIVREFYNFHFFYASGILPCILEPYCTYNNMCIL